MKHIATLVNGQSYYVHGVQFEKGVPMEVSDELARYLVENGQFEVKVDNPPSIEKAAPKAKKKAISEQVGEA